MAKDLVAKARSGVGKGAARALRRQGLIPAVIYGDKKPPLAIAISTNEANKRIYAGGFLSHILTLDVDGEKHRVIPRDYQLDPVKDFPVHVDFLRLAEGKSVRVVVPVRVVGQDKSPGIKRGGTLQVVGHSVELMAPSDAIPDAIEASVADLDIGGTIHLENITLPEGVRPVSTENITLVTVVPPSGMQEEQPAAAEAAAAAAPAKA
jgi:large subunit ribosomal protein L25